MEEPDKEVYYLIYETEEDKDVRDFGIHLNYFGMPISTKVVNKKEDGGNVILIKTPIDEFTISDLASTDTLNGILAHHYDKWNTRGVQ